MRSPLAAVTVLGAILCAPASGQVPQAKPHLASAAPLRQFNASLEALAAAVTPAVVQIQVSGYSPRNDGPEGAVGMVTRQRSVGSGVILDSGGFIMTNAHVVDGAQRIRVVLSLPGDPAATISRNRVYEATLVGSDKDTDLALLRIEASNLPTLALGVDQAVHAGELVLAVGSPEGLHNSVTMGVVSSVWRQPERESPTAFIQTDAPINPGNSGGPLVNLDGAVVGINTFIYSTGGGSEGLGFAIPAQVIKFVYDGLKSHGRVRRLELRAAAQTITPAIAEGLGLARDWGIVIADVLPDGAAASGGLQPRDIVLAVDGRPVSSHADFTNALNLHPLESPLALEVLRGGTNVALSIPALQRKDTLANLADLVDPKSRLPRLGIFGVNFSEDVMPVLGSVRLHSGVVVVAQSLEPSAVTQALRPGDVIHALNQVPILSMEDLRSALRAIRPGSSGVLTTERQGRMFYLTLEMD